MPPPAKRRRKARARILVVEDSPDMSQLIRLTLQQEGYEVAAVKNGEAALRVARRRLPDMVILDMGLPGMDGFEVLKVLRLQSRVPVIILTGSRESSDCIVGLKLGADDYLVKPIVMPELAARVEAVLRRSPARSAASTSRETRGALSLDPGTHEVLMGKETVRLEPKEFHILRLLLEAHGRVVGRREILLEVWGYAKDLGMDQRMVDQYVSRIRRKLKAQGRRIVTVPTLGYKIRL